jgi:tetratricopeptide (TPR) repeat protein
LSELEAESGNIDKAISEGLKAIELDSNNAKAHFAIGNLHLEKHDDALAIRSFQEAVALNPQMSEANFMLATIYESQGKIHAAITEAEKALKLNPIFPRFHLLLGNLYFSNKNYQAALQEYEEAVELNPLLDEAHFRVGEVHYAQEQYMEAIIRYRFSLQCNPHFADSQRKIGNIYYQLGEYTQAVQQYKAALKIRPNMIVAKTDCADALTASNNFLEAILYYQEAAHSANILSEKADRFAEHGLYHQSIKEYRKLLKLESTVNLNEPTSKKLAHENLIENDERRQYTRLAIRFPVDIHTKNTGEYIVAKTLNISKRGLLVETDAPIQLNSDIEVISKIDSDGKRITSKGKIVRIASKINSEKQKFGIELIGDNGVWEKFMAV